MLIWSFLWLCDPSFLQRFLIDTITPSVFCTVEVWRYLGILLFIVYCCRCLKTAFRYVPAYECLSEAMRSFLLHSHDLLLVPTLFSRLFCIIRD